MASIELDIIKQRAERLTPAEKRELMDYLTASLDDGDAPDPLETDTVNLTGDDIKAA